MYAGYPAGYTYELIWLGGHTGQSSLFKQRNLKTDDLTQFVETIIVLEKIITRRLMNVNKSPRRINRNAGGRNKKVKIKNVMRRERLRSVCDGNMVICC